MKERSPVLILIVLAFSCALTIWNLVTNIYEWSKEIDKLTEHKTHQVLYNIDLGAVLLERVLPADVDRLLSQAFNAENVDFYWIQEDEKVLFKTKNVDDALVASVTSGEGRYFIKRENGILGTVKIGNLRLTAGIITSHRQILLRALDIYKWELIRNILMTIALVSLIAVYYFRDFSLIVKLIQGKKRNELQGLRTRSREAEVIVSGVQAMDRASSELAEKLDILKEQITPAIRYEIQNRRNPPYDFNCVLVRIDINDFSTIFSSHPREMFMNTVNSYFYSVSALVARYNGYICDYVGDEIIFYFKYDSLPNEAVVNAFCCIRDAFSEATRFNEKTHKEGFSFHVKASFSSGALRFGPQVDRLSLAGSPFIESVRILSQINEKHQNTLLFPSEFDSLVSSFGEIKKEGFFDLKGIREKKELSSCTSFFVNPDAISERLTNQPDDLVYFLNDEMLLLTIHHIKTRLSLDVDPNRSDLDWIWHAIRKLRGVKVYGASSELILRALDLTEHIMTFKDEEIVRLLAGWVGVLDRFLISSKEEEKEVKRLVGQLLNFGNDRVVSNTLELMYRLRISNFDFTKLTRHGDNRRTANIAIATTIVNGLTNDSLKLLRKLISSDDKSKTLSGIYGLRVIVDYLEETDPVIVQTNRQLHRLIRLAFKSTQGDLELTKSVEAIHEKVTKHGSVYKKLRHFPNRLFLRPWLEREETNVRNAS